MTVIAVTGTNGKTSVTQFLAQALESLGQPCGIIGTLGTGRICDLELTGMTTPDPVSIQRFLAGFKAQSCPYVVLEASSHALEQGRLNSVEIDVAVLTNLTRDHLDYHQTMEAYSAAKAKLFNFSSVKTAVLNMDDEFGQQLKQSINNQVDVLTYASEQAADIIATDIQCSRDGLSFDVTKPNMQYAVHSSLLGRFNVDNLLATAAVLYSLGYEQEQVKKSVEHCHAVSGRMQAYGEQHQPMVVIDYAHTPDALEQALMTLRAHLPDNGQLWCVFGCGGDRDKGKRSLMGNIAETLADMVVVTDDNPRTEDHIAIVKDILSGCAEPEKVHVEHDRKQAIIFAINHAHEQDIILVAGKGHEAYQEVNQVKYPFCDATVVSDHLLTLASGVQNLARAH
jgi:UDP-N-acetylmuramoyl-L-alanyl-D-glutamate--2,6-diaminopimelate ligase